MTLSDSLLSAAWKSPDPPDNITGRVYQNNPNKLTCALQADGSQDCVLDIVEVRNAIPEDLKPYLERRKRELREARDRSRQQPPPDDAPPSEPAPPP